jgi:hypothetical protein
MFRSLTHILLAALVSLIAGAPAAADGRHGAHLAFPNWQIRMSEEPYANDALEDGIKRYPITAMLDGDICTAWVFEGVKWEGGEIDDWRRPLTNAPFDGGVGQWVEIMSLSSDPPIVDAIGIVNGYARSPEAYRRNNRITRVRLDGGGSPWGPVWSETAKLKEVMWMQVIPIPETRADRVRITVEAVEVGPDNDLCISELQLFHRGRALIQRPTAYVFCSSGAECGCGGSLEFSDSRCRRVWKTGDGGRLSVGGYDFSPDGNAAAAFGEAEDLVRQFVVVVDLASGRRLFHEIADVHPTDIRWVSPRQVEVETFGPEHDPYARLHYRVDLGDPRPQLRLVTE